MMTSAAFWSSLVWAHPRSISKSLLSSNIFPYARFWPRWGHECPKSRVWASIVSGFWASTSLIEFSPLMHLIKLSGSSIARFAIVLEGVEQLWDIANFDITRNFRKPKFLAQQSSVGHSKQYIFSPRVWVSVTPICVVGPELKGGVLLCRSIVGNEGSLFSFYLYVALQIVPCSSLWCVCCTANSSMLFALMLLFPCLILLIPSVLTALWICIVSRYPVPLIKN